MKNLQKYDMSEDIFDKIVDELRYSKAFFITDKFDKFIVRPIKDRIIYNGIDKMIIPTYLLKDFIEIEYNSWSQVIVAKNKTLELNKYTLSITGSKAWAYMMILLKKYYTLEEIDACLKSFTAPYIEKKAQLHYFTDVEPETIKICDNCYKYDINGAHNEALRTIFPKAAEDITRMFNERKKNPVFKQYINYFVGMLCRRGYRTTYNWIVQRVTSTLKEAMLDTFGKILYVNTDGFVVQNPERLLKTGKELGDLKLEYQGRIAFYKDINYFCFQLEDKRITGNVRYRFRDEIDLFEGNVIHYILKKNVTEDGLVEEYFENINSENIKENIVYEEI